MIDPLLQPTILLFVHELKVEIYMFQSVFVKTVPCVVHFREG